MSVKLIRNILFENEKYSVSGTIIKEPYYVQKGSFIFLSLIVKDIEKAEIEIVAYDDEATAFREQCNVNDFVNVKNATAIKNMPIKYQKTEHRMKLLLNSNSTITKENHVKYKKNNMIYIKKCETAKKTKKPSNKIEKGAKQTSIINWFK